MTGKFYAQRIECESLSLRNRLKRLNQKDVVVLDIHINARQTDWIIY
ncbi:hypothetical protein KFQ18_24450 (plasmid) [Escherichia coli]|nr:hypothetical protein KFQ18_24450 [Escherichia coli]